MTCLQMETILAVLGDDRRSSNPMVHPATLKLKFDGPLPRSFSGTIRAGPTAATFSPNLLNKVMANHET